MIVDKIENNIWTRTDTDENEVQNQAADEGMVR